MTTRGRPHSVALLTIGFRPFYLLAGAFAAVALPIWHFAPGDVLPAEPYLAGAAWHAHEMVFGFAAAVLTGFLLTAARAWTGLATPTGWRLAGAGRCSGSRDGCWWRRDRRSRPSWWTACSCPAVALVVALPGGEGAATIGTCPVAAVPALLGAANLLFHLDHEGLIALARVNGGALLALDLFALLVTLMAGRVIPAFTANAVPTARPRRNPYVEVAAFGTLAVLLVAGPLEPWLPGGPWLAGIAGLGCIGPHRAALALGPCRDAPRAAALGAAALLRLAAGGADLARVVAGRCRRAGGRGLSRARSRCTMGGIMLGMMTRSALGHTGRPLAAGRVELTAYVLVHLGAALRVFGPIAGADAEPHAFAASAVLWSGGFALFFAAYWPVLTRPRIDEASAPQG